MCVNINIDIIGILHLKTLKCLSDSNVTFEYISGRFDKRIYSVFYNTIRIFKTSHYNVSYICPCCSVPNTILLSNFIRKLNANKRIFKCLSCTHIDKNVKNTKNTDISSLLPNMNIHVNASDYEYLPNFGSHNNNEPVLRMKQDNTIIRINNRFVICSHCLDIFFMKKFKGDCLVCPDCSQSKHTKPKTHEGLMYVTKFEFKFIKYCLQKRIPLENSTAYMGLKRIPFYIPCFNVFIDLKSNLCHHYNKPDSQLYVNHIIVYPKTYVQITRTLDQLCSKFNTKTCTTHKDECLNIRQVQSNL